MRRKAVRWAVSCALQSPSISILIGHIRSRNTRCFTVARTVWGQFIWRGRYSGKWKSDNEQQWGGQSRSVQLFRGWAVLDTVANDVLSIDSGFGDTKAQTEEGDAKGSRESQGYGSGSGVGG